MRANNSLPGFVVHKRSELSAIGQIKIIFVLLFHSSVCADS